ncbi:hypothetical protein BHE74_00055885 [Ensete ventricosum]|nr:hypothetical protein BHE74_00055885 [Ensete ventricosum]
MLSEEHPAGIEERLTKQSVTPRGEADVALPMPETASPLRCKSPSPSSSLERCHSRSLPSVLTPTALNLLTVASCEALLICLLLLLPSLAGAIAFFNHRCLAASARSLYLPVALAAVSQPSLSDDSISRRRALSSSSSLGKEKNVSSTSSTTSALPRATLPPFQPPTPLLCSRSPASLAVEVLQPTQQQHRLPDLHYYSDRSEITLWTGRLCIFSSIADCTYYFPICKAITSFRRSTTRLGIESPTTSSSMTSLAFVSTSSLLLLPYSFRCRRAAALIAAAAIAI